MITFAGYPTVFETLTRGRSLGKLALGLRTVRDDAGPITFHHALVRALIGFVEIYLLSGVPAFFSMLISQRGKRLGDYAAGTYVIRDRVTLRLPLPPPMPPQLGELGAHRRPGEPPDRPHARHPSVPRPVRHPRSAVAAAGRRRPGHRGEAVRRSGTTGGRPTELVLGAVIAERRERDLARLRRDEEFRDGSRPGTEGMSGWVGWSDHDQHQRRPRMNTRRTRIALVLVMVGPTYPPGHTFSPAPRAERGTLVAPQPGEVAVAPVRDDGGEDHLRWGAAGGAGATYRLTSVTRSSPTRAATRVEAGEPSEELAYGEREAGRKTRQVGGAAQFGQLRRHRRRERQAKRDPVADHVGAGGVVAEALAALADQHREERGHPESR